MLEETWPFKEKGWKMPCFSQYPLGNAHKGVRQLLSTDKTKKESQWEMRKGNWEASGGIPKVCIKAPGKCPNTSCQPIGEEPGLSSGYQQKHGNFHLFPLKCCIYVDMDKNKRHVEKF